MLSYKHVNTIRAVSQFSPFFLNHNETFKRNYKSQLQAVTYHLVVDQKAEI